MEKLRRGERAELYETVRITKDGRRIHVSLTVSPIRDNAGRITGVSSVDRDITDRKLVEMKLQEQEKALRSSEQRYRSLFEEWFMASIGSGGRRIPGSKPGLGGDARL